MEKEKKNALEKFGNAYESYGYTTTSNIVSRLLNGFFLFKKRKGEILAGATTFFAILSFCPSIMLMISLLGYMTGDMVSSKAIVLDSIRENIPHMAPWIYKSISSIVEDQLNSKASVNVVNILFLGYSLLGLVSAFMYGTKTIAQKKTHGGFLVDDLRSFFVGTAVSSFLMFLLVSTNPTLLKMTLFAKGSPFPQELLPIFNYQILPVAASLGFFTLFYKFTAGHKIPIKNAFIGASTFVSCFLIGKSFHWIYIKMTKADLAVSYGNFYTLVVAVLWMYFITCSFFFGASVANVRKRDLHAARHGSSKLELQEENTEVYDKAA